MVLDFLSEGNIPKILGRVYLRYSGESRFQWIALKNKGREAGQKHRAGVKESDDNKGSGKLRSKWLRTTVIVASFLLILTIGLFVWNSSNRTPPDSGQQPGLEAPKAAILDGLYSESPNPAFSQSLTNYLNASGYTVDIFRGENVTIDLLRNIAGYKVMVLRLHSAIHSDRNLYIFSGEPYTESKYTMEQLTGSVRKANTTEGKLYFAINIALLGNKKPDGLKDSTVILMGCHGVSDQYSVDRLLENGVETYFGWTGYVDLSHTDQATLVLVKALCVEKLSPEQAVQEAMTKVGPDPIYDTVYECRIREG